MFLIHWVFGIAFVAGRLEAQNIGERCILEATAGIGTCRSLRQCPSVRVAVHNGIDQQTCTGYTGTVPIVCCPLGQHTPPTVAPEIYLKIKTSDDVTRTTRRPRRPTRPAGQCPPFKETAVRAKKRGQKAWDKCIDLAESVWPCKDSGYHLHSEKTRINDCAHISTVLIVSGKQADPGEFPHIAALGYGVPDIKWHCGGSLVSERWVITAAHCLHVPKGEKLNYVRLGGGDRTSTPLPDHIFSVDQIVKHPDHKPPAKYNDIALIKLDRKVRFTKLVRPACLHTGGRVNDDKALVSGWGATRVGGDASDSLLKTTVHVFSLENCSESNPSDRRFLPQGVNDTTQICFGHETLKQDTCQGDSGGPLQIANDANVQCTYLLIGITSNGKTCGEPGIPGIYTRVSAYIPWIESVVWPDEGDN